MPLNPDTLIVVHCYSDDLVRVQNFLPVFTHHERPILLLSPEDAPVTLEHTGIAYASAGGKGWKGPQTIHRQVAHWRLALEYEPYAHWFLLNDSDSMCLDPQLPDYLYADPNMVWANVLCHENEHQEDDHPNLNPPYFMSRHVLQQLLDKAEEIREDIPQDAFLEPHDWGQAIDGFYTHLVSDLLHIPFETYPDGATTWPRGRQEVLDLTQKGAIFIHGIKDSQDLGLCLMHHKLWKAMNNPAYEPATGFFEGDTVTL